MRLVIDTLVTVRILPSGQREFSSDTIDIRFKQHRHHEAAPQTEAKPAKRTSARTTAKAAA